MVLNGGGFILDGWGVVVDVDSCSGEEKGEEIAIVFLGFRVSLV